MHFYLLSFIFSLFSLTASASEGDTRFAATAHSEVFGDGAKITTVVLTYPQPIDGTSLDTTTYLVDGRQITAVYASATAQKGTPADSGPYVIIELHAQTEMQADRQMGGGGGKPMERRAGPPTQGPGRGNRNDKPYADTVWVAQQTAIRTVDGQSIAPSAGKTAAVSSRVLVADDFTQEAFYHAATGITLRYNLYTPAHQKAGERYPLVLFMHDASGAGRADTRHTLLQGNGAIVWATPEWQAQHPCYVVAPQFDQITVGDNFSTTDDLDACLALLDSLIAHCAIDPYRVYTTGQSMGCMSSYELMYRRPDLFASAMLVAGQWNPAVMPSLAHMNLWLLTCKGDDRSSNGIAQAIEVWNQCGVSVVEQEWPLLATPEERSQQVEGMLRRGGNIHYTHFAGGSHNNTWRIAYYIDGVREWLFQQRRPLPADSIVTLLRNPMPDSSFEDSRAATLGTPPARGEMEGGFHSSLPSVFVAAYQGDAHGATPSSIQAIRKAQMKGALLALVDVLCPADAAPTLASGESLAAALDTLGDGILLLVRTDNEATAQAVEKVAESKGRTSQILLYGVHPSVQLNHIAVVDADQVTDDDLRQVLAAQPLAVEIDYTGSDDAPRLKEVIEQIQPHARILFNTAEPNRAGQHSDTASRPGESQTTWAPLIQLGGTLLLTNQIKPLLTWLRATP